MVHERFAYEMPADAEVVFDAFHYSHWRHRWDSLVNATHWQTNRRFARMRRFLQVHAGEVRAWQQGERGG
jgi:hypothetical protein